MSKPVFVAGALVAAQLVAIGVMRATSRTADGDPFDAPLYWWSWVVWPAVGFVAARRFRRTPPAVWPAAVTAPMLAAVVWAGTIGHDPNDGASFWIVGAGVVVVQGTLVLAAATLGAGS